MKKSSLKNPVREINDPLYTNTYSGTFSNAVIHQVVNKKPHSDRTPSFGRSYLMKRLFQKDSSCLMGESQNSQNKRKPHPEKEILD